MNVVTCADDRRRFKRFDVCVEGHLFWKCADRVRGTCLCKTRDVSTHGAFIVASSCPAEGTVVTFEFSLPSSGMTRLMTLRGRVIRTEVIAQKTYAFALYADKQASVIGVA